jgi:hypothetical protein
MAGARGGCLFRTRTLVMLTRGAEKSKNHRVHTVRLGRLCPWWTLGSSSRKLLQAERTPVSTSRRLELIGGVPVAVCRTARPLYKNTTGAGEEQRGAHTRDTRDTRDTRITLTPAPLRFDRWRLGV